MSVDHSCEGIIEIIGIANLNHRAKLNSQRSSRLLCLSQIDCTKDVSGIPYDGHVLRPLPSTGITRLQRYNGPPATPNGPCFRYLLHRYDCYRLERPLP